MQHYIVQRRLDASTQVACLYGFVLCFYKHEYEEFAEKQSEPTSIFRHT